MLVNQTAVIHHVILGQRRRMSRNDHPVFDSPGQIRIFPRPEIKIFDTGIFSGQTGCRELLQLSGRENRQKYGIASILAAHRRRSAMEIHCSVISSSSVP